jgi:hypothetical protein
MKAVVDGMVDPAVVLAAELEVEAGDTKMIVERRVVRAGAERAQEQIRALPRLLSFVSRACGCLL